MINSVRSDNVGISATYPALKMFKSDHVEVVVLFTEASKGVVVSSTNKSYYRVGEYSTDWVESKFSLYLGKVTLDNTNE